MKQTTGVFAVLTAALFLGSMVGVGCGGDDDTTGSGGTGGSGGSAGTGGSAGKAGSGTGGTAGSTGGSSGAAGSAGKDGGGGTAGAEAGTDAPTTVTCGTRTCQPVANTPLGTLPACCPLPEMNACGGTVSVAGNACITTTPGTADASCPSFSGGGQTLAGCCRTTGTCGYNFGLLSLGCADPVSLGQPAGAACGGDGGGGMMDVRTDPPTGDAPTGDAPTGDAPPTSDAPTGDAPTGDAPTGDAPTGDAPTGDAPTGDAPASDAPASDVTPG